MTDAAPNPVLVETWRGAFLETEHRGAVAVSTPTGALDLALGAVDRPFLPRSAIKPFQALPLIESGAADARRLDARRLALACASHQGSTAHASQVAGWLAEMGLGESDLLCGPQTPGDAATRAALRQADAAPCQLHNNCSGKHAGFLTLALHLGAPAADYIAIDHPAQRAVADAFAEATDANAAPGWAVDGCSAPNFETDARRLALAAARLARPDEGFSPGRRADAAARLRDAMAAHPFEVAGDGRACTELTEACAGRAVMKTGAEGSFIVSFIARGLGAAVKIDDGSGEAAQCVVAALLVRYGAADPADPRVAARLAPALRNRRGVVTGRRGPAVALAGR